MTGKRIIAGQFAALLCLCSMQAQETRLTGTILGSDAGQAAKAFDGALDTHFTGNYCEASPYYYLYGRNWVGLDLGEPHVISRVGIAPGQGYEQKARFAVVQGANSADFSDALPIMMVKDTPQSGRVTYLDVAVSRGFRYVRVVATNGVGNFAEVEFYGTPGEGDDSQFYQITNLPTVSFNTPGMAEIKSKDDKHKNSFVAVISDNGRKILTDGAAQMKGRGNGSWTFNKKPFQVKFDKKQTPLDAPAKAKKWTLINNYGDRSLMRNKVAFEMSRKAGMKYTPYCTFVDVIYNGEYEGTYQLCDQVEVNPGRVDITEMLPEDIGGEALTGGYLIEIDAYANEEISKFTSRRGIPVTIKSPDDDEITSAQTKYITDFFNTMETALWSQNFTDPQTGYRRYLDLESFLRYFIVCELDGNIDSFWSTYMYKDRSDSLLHVGPVWDVDLGFQNYGNPNPVNNMTDFLYTHRNASKAEGMADFVDRIIKQDVAAREQLSMLWSRLRCSSDFNYEYFESYIDQCARELDESQRLNFERWPILNMSVQKSQRVFGSYEGEVSNIKSYLKDRFTKLDQLIGLCQVYDAPMAPDDVKLTVAPDYDMATLSWTAPGQVGVNGGYVDASQLTYSVYDALGQDDGEALVTTDRTSVEIPYDYLQGQDFFAYKVVAVNDEGRSVGATSNIITAGMPGAMPFGESFAAGVFDGKWLIDSAADPAMEHGIMGDDGATVSHDGDNGYYSWHPIDSGASLGLMSVRTDISQASNPVLEFWYQGQGSRIDLLVAGGTGNPALIHSIDLNETPAEGWTLARVPLDDFKAKGSVQFEIMLSSMQSGADLGSGVRLDNIRIRDLQRVDLRVVTADIPSSVQAGNLLTVKVHIENRGTETVDGISAVLTVEGEPVMAGQLDGMEPDTFRDVALTYPVSLVAPDRLGVELALVATGHATAVTIPAAADVDVTRTGFATVTDLTATATDAGIRLEWSAPINGFDTPAMPDDLEVTGYHIFRDGKAVGDGAVTGLSYVDSPLSDSDADGTYHFSYTVVPVYNYGPAVQSNVAEVDVDHTAMAVIAIDELDAGAVIYNLQGMQVPRSLAMPGVHIVVANGRAARVMLR